MANGVGMKEGFALVVCDMQPDLLKSLPDASREALIKTLRLCIEAARKAGWFVVFTGVRFQSRYAGVSPEHRIYGGFQRLNAKMGDEKVHWFMAGYDGTEIEPSLGKQAGDAMVWRGQHLPSPDLLNALLERRVTKVAIAGVKAGYAVQAICQLLCDRGMRVHVIKECVQDDDQDRLAAVLNHLLPIYAELDPLEDFLDGLGVEAAAVAPEVEMDPLYKYCTDCNRGGHFKLYAKCLLGRSNWKAYPDQEWYHDDYWKEYRCPLGKRIVDFADEPQFSKVAMYLKGREWLEDKIKIMDLAWEHMPKTYFIENSKWKGVAPPDDSQVSIEPWFVKEANKNWGRSVQCCSKPSECLALTEPNARYVVQQHIADPLLMDDGRKCHIKFYMLLACMEDAITWTFYTRKDGFLSISPNKWSPEDLSSDTQVTIIRSDRISRVQGWTVWPRAYPKCKAVVSKIISKAVQDGKLFGRPGKKQFEIFSADFIVDTHENVWMFEFNLDPVLRDEDYSPIVNDVAEIRAALSIVMPEPGEESDTEGVWDFAGKFVASLPEESRTSSGGYPNS